MHGFIYSSVKKNTKIQDICTHIHGIDFWAERSGNHLKLSYCQYCFYNYLYICITTNCTCQVTWKRLIKVTNEIIIVSQLPLNDKKTLQCSYEPRAIIVSLKVGCKRGWSRSKSDWERQSMLALLVLNSQHKLKGKKMNSRGFQKLPMPLF